MKINLARYDVQTRRIIRENTEVWRVQGKLSDFSIISL